ncbi:MAG: aspartate carbamoyltransferase [Anaerolineae bacterium]
MATPLKAEEIFAHLAAPEWQITNDFRGKDIISVEQLSREAIWKVLSTANDLETMPFEKRHRALESKAVAVLFYQPSTRTYTSFTRAAQALGADVLGIHGMMQYSSAYKGETLADTVRSMDARGFDSFVLRHFDVDSALIAARSIEIPIINAGSGKLEHPTQALLDVRTIIKETHNHNPQELHIVFVGDLKYGRTVHSLSKLMAILGAPEMSFVSPDVLRMPRNLIAGLNERGVETHETSSLNEVLEKADVLYITRVQREWFSTEEAYEEARSGQQITPAVMERIKPEAVLMHPLPRVDEITAEVDSDPRAAYFRQVGHGLWVRMALLKLVLGG